MSALTMELEGRAVTKIVDLGCGTGRFSDALAMTFGAEVIGVDPSTKMLDQARGKRHDGRVRYVHGRAEAIPLESASVDVVFASMSFHHFGDPRLAATECRRVLGDEGVVFLRTGTRERVASYPYVPHLPSTLALLERLLPDARELQDVFELAGFELRALRVITQTIANSWAAYADKLEAGSDSVLARLSREELERGIATIRALGVSDAAIVEPIDLFVFQAPRKLYGDGRAR